MLQRLGCASIRARQVPAILSSRSSRHGLRLELGIRRPQQQQQYVSRTRAMSTTGPAEQPPTMQPARAEPIITSTPTTRVNARRKRPTFDKSDMPGTRAPPPPEPLTMPIKYKLAEHCALVIWKGDLGLWFIDGKTDAIVCPANKRMNGGYGVDGTTHQYAGPKLPEFIARLPDTPRYKGQGIKCDGCEAVVTPSFNCKVSRIIHAVGPIWEREKQEEAKQELYDTYLAALIAGTKEGCRFIAFPEISCETYGIPYDVGADCGLRAVKENCNDYQEIHFVLKIQEAYDAWAEASKRML